MEKLKYDDTRYIIFRNYIRNAVFTLITYDQDWDVCEKEDDFKAKREDSSPIYLEIVGRVINIVSLKVTQAIAIDFTWTSDFYSLLTNELFPELNKKLFDFLNKRFYYVNYIGLDDIYGKKYQDFYFNQFQIFIKNNQTFTSPRELSLYCNINSTLKLFSLDSFIFLDSSSSSIFHPIYRYVFGDFLRDIIKSKRDSVAFHNFNCELKDYQKLINEDDKVSKKAKSTIDKVIDNFNDSSYINRNLIIKYSQDLFYGDMDYYKIETIKFKLL